MKKSYLPTNIHLSTKIFDQNTKQFRPVKKKSKKQSNLINQSKSISIFQKQLFQSKQKKQQTYEINNTAKRLIKKFQWEVQKKIIKQKQIIQTAKHINHILINLEQNLPKQLQKKSQLQSLNKSKSKLRLKIFKESNKKKQIHEPTLKIKQKKLQFYKCQSIQISNNQKLNQSSKKIQQSQKNKKQLLLRKSMILKSNNNKSESLSQNNKSTSNNYNLGSSIMIRKRNKIFSNSISKFQDSRYASSKKLMFVHPIKVNKVNKTLDEAVPIINSNSMIFSKKSQIEENEIVQQKRKEAKSIRLQQLLIRDSKYLKQKQRLFNNYRVGSIEFDQQDRLQSCCI